MSTQVSHSSQSHDDQIRLIEKKEIEYIVDEDVGYLGSGSFGVVIAAFLNNKAVAAKCSIFRGGSRDKDILKKEVQSELGLLYRAHHKNVVRVFGWTMWKHSVAIIMEYMPGGNLWVLLRNKKVFVSMGLTFQFCYDIACGLAHIHRKGLVHSDIKPENILLDENLRCKIADFGCAKLSALYTGYSMKSKACRASNNFTVVYAAPELLENQCIDRHPSQDTFSFAIVMYVVLERDYKAATLAYGEELYLPQVKKGVRPQFSAETEKRLQTAEISDEVELLKKTMKDCWSHVPKDRPAMSKVENDLQTLYENLNQGNIAKDVVECKKAHKIIFLNQEDHQTSPLANYEIPKGFLGTGPLSTDGATPLSTDNTGGTAFSNRYQNNDAGANNNNHSHTASTTEVAINQLPLPPLYGNPLQPNMYLYPPQSYWQLPFQPLSQNLQISPFFNTNQIQPVERRLPTSIAVSAEAPQATSTIPAGSSQYATRSPPSPANSLGQPVRNVAYDQYFNPYYSTPPQSQLQLPAQLGPFPAQNLLITLQLVPNPSPHMMMPNFGNYFQNETSNPQTSGGRTVAFAPPTQYPVTTMLNTLTSDATMSNSRTSMLSTASAVSRLISPSTGDVATSSTSSTGQRFVCDDAPADAPPPPRSDETADGFNSK